MLDVPTTVGCRCARCRIWLTTHRTLDGRNAPDERKTPLATAAVAALFATDAAGETRPSTAVAPHIVPAGSGVGFTSTLTVGDSVRMKHKGNEGHHMVGVPHGLGAHDNGDGTFTRLLNHERRQASRPTAACES